MEQGQTPPEARSGRSDHWNIEVESRDLERHAGVR
jgi:hypothetical protein